MDARELSQHLQGAVQRRQAALARLRDVCASGFVDYATFREAMDEFLSAERELYQAHVEWAASRPHPAKGADGGASAGLSPARAPTGRAAAVSSVSPVAAPTGDTGSMTRQVDTGGPEPGQEPFEPTPQLRFLRWLVRNGRLSDDLPPPAPGSALHFTRWLVQNGRLSDS